MEEKPAESIGSIFIQDVTKVDCAMFEPALGIRGQSWHLDVELTGVLDENGFVYDFSYLKQLIKQVAKSSIDHALLIPVRSQWVNYTESPEGEHWTLQAKTSGTNDITGWEYLCPHGAVFPVRTVALKCHAIEQEFAKLLKHRLPATIHGIKIKLREELSDPTEAFFRYTHGIAGHQGLCQRLFHGHRSRVEVHVNQERRPDLEHYITRELFGGEVHIATPAQIVEGDFEPGARSSSSAQMVVACDGTLGHYKAVLPANRVFVVEHETSIECIARQLAIAIEQKIGRKDRIRVACFEGIGKGGIAYQG